MEPVTFLLWLGGIVGAGVSAGALSKSGENIIDRFSPAAIKVFDRSTSCPMSMLGIYH
jgi:hypothetical protein